MLYLDSTLTVATGLSSTPCSLSSKLSSQSSNCVSFEKSASTAPAFVPVAIKGCVEPGDQAKVAVLGISRRRTMVVSGGDGTSVSNQRIVESDNEENDVQSSWTCRAGKEVYVVKKRSAQCVKIANLDVKATTCFTMEHPPVLPGTSRALIVGPR